MIAREQIRAGYQASVHEFAGSAEFDTLVSGQATPEFVREFIRNVFRTHYLSSHIVALCYAALPSTTAPLLKANLLEEMGVGDGDPPHAALLVELAEGCGFTASEINELSADARRRVGEFCATRVALPTLREICLALLIETLSFEFMLSSCSRRIAAALAEHYAIPKSALRWFELHSEVDVRHAEEGLTVIEDYLAFHRINDAMFDRLQRLVLNNVFRRHYFPPQQRSLALPGNVRRDAQAIETITVYQLRIPFRQTFRHATWSRDESDAVIVRLKDSDGATGFGEALPRPYVTGETTSSMAAHIRDRLAAAVFQRSWHPGWDSFDFLRSVFLDWTRSNDAAVVAWNAAFCAVEMALLDWSLRRLNQALADFVAPVRNEVTYSGVIPSDKPTQAALLAARMVKFGVRQLKIKVGTAEDLERVALVRQAVGNEVALRADANGAWSAVQALDRLKQLEPFHLHLIEQPVAASDYIGLRRVRDESGLPVMADESLVTIEHARRLIEQRACDYFNIRLSKCGGITGSLAIAKLAREAGINIQLGAQVGETGLLSAAGRTVAAHLADLSLAEGSFGTWLLTEDITFEDVSFGYAGIAPLLKTSGLSVTVKEDVLEQLAVEKIVLTR